MRERPGEKEEECVRCERKEKVSRTVTVSGCTSWFVQTYQ